MKRLMRHRQALSFTYSKLFCSCIQFIHVGNAFSCMKIDRNMFVYRRIALSVFHGVSQFCFPTSFKALLVVFLYLTSR